MTQEEIQALVKSAVEQALKAHSTTLLKDVSDYVDNRTIAYEDRLTAFEQDKATKDNEAVVTNPNEVNPESPLAKRLALLESELSTAKAEKEAQDKQSRLLKFKNTLSDTLASKKDIQNSKVVHELLYNRLVDGYEEKDGAFITKTGKTVQEEVDTFLTTEEGSHFVKPTQVVNTPGFKQPSVRANKVETKLSLAQALMGRS